MARNLKSSSDNTAPEEHGSGHAKVGRGNNIPYEGFSEGMHGRGPTPYKKSHSGGNHLGHSIDSHMGTSGRGGTGIIGMGDGFKGRSEDVESPASHADFESLGAD